MSVAEIQDPTERLETFEKFSPHGALSPRAIVLFDIACSQRGQKFVSPCGIEFCLTLSDRGR